MGILSTSAITAVVTEVLLPIVKKAVSKPKLGIKEAGAATAMMAAMAIYDQYMLGGYQAIDPTSVATLTAGVWVMIVRLIQKANEVGK